MAQKITARLLWNVTKDAFSKWWAKDPFRESATIAYYAIFSIPALLAIVVAIAGFFFGHEAVNGQISAQISSVMSAEAAEQVESMVAKAIETKQSVFATIIGVITLLFGATGVLVQFQKSLNNIWEVKIASDKREWLHTIQSRLFSLGIIVTLGFLLLISMAVTVVLSALSEWITQRFPDVVAYVIEAANFLISITVIAVLFGLMYKILPDARIKWRHVVLGGFLTAFLFVLGKFAIGFYFGKSDPASAYGAAGSIVLMLLWVSYSSMIVFLGAEFTKAYVINTGGKVVPKKNAVYVPGLEAEVTRANSSSEQQNESSSPVSPGKLKPDNNSEKDLFANVESTSPSKKWLRIAFFAWPLVSILFNMVPFLRRFIMNKVLGKIKNADTYVKSIQLSLLKHSCTIKGIQYDKIGFAEDETLDCSAELVEITFDWKALWRGVLICEAVSDGISFHIIKQKESNSKGEVMPLLSEGLQTDVPIILRQLEIKNSKISYSDTTKNPDLKVEADNIKISVAHLANVRFNEDPLPARLSLRANIYNGFITLRMKANLLEKTPAFDIDAELVALDMVALNDFFKAYGKFDVHQGTIGFFSEVAAKDGVYKGYVKPVIRNLKVLGPEDKHENVFAKMWEGTIDLAATLLKNQNKNQLASKVPFNGKFKPRINAWYAMQEVLVNAFVYALKPSIDYEISIHSVEEEQE